MLPPVMQGANDPGEPEPNESDVAPEVREQILDEFREQAAMEQFQKERPDLWLQVQRVGKLMEFQNHLEDQTFPEGACFLHTGTPNFTCFNVKQVMEIDLDTCLVTLEIYSDHELDAGIVMLPLEGIAWFGFPANAVPLDFTFQGFTGLAGHTSG